MGFSVAQRRAFACRSAEPGILSRTLTISFPGRPAVPRVAGKDVVRLSRRRRRVLAASPEGE
jgi:hypothetical protein